MSASARRRTWPPQLLRTECRAVQLPVDCLLDAGKKVVLEGKVGGMQGLQMVAVEHGATRCSLWQDNPSHDVIKQLSLDAAVSPAYGMRDTMIDASTSSMRGEGRRCSGYKRHNHAGGDWEDYLSVARFICDNLRCNALFRCSGLGVVSRLRLTTLSRRSSERDAARMSTIRGELGKEGRRSGCKRSRCRGNARTPVARLESMLLPRPTATTGRYEDEASAGAARPLEHKGVKRKNIVLRNGRRLVGNVRVHSWCRQVAAKDQTGHES
ncbi:hypothetical protein C8F01DRAFT_1232229 [Mycena amicta]|nr:hypothetical protein C8F01DRAFT_1232229 [Mycena amicta]